MGTMTKELRIHPNVTFIACTDSPLNVAAINLVVNAPYMGPTTHCTNIYKRNAVKLRDWLNDWIETEERREKKSSLTDDDINLLKEIQRKMAVLHRELNDAIAAIRDR
jgi:hypothetical protein